MAKNPGQSGSADVDAVLAEVETAKNQPQTMGAAPNAPVGFPDPARALDALAELLKWFRDWRRS